MRHQVVPFQPAKNNQTLIKTFKIAVVCARFNFDINERLLNGVFACFEDAELVFDHHQDIYYVPGSFEIPLVCQKLAQLKKYDAIICIGTLIKGESDHYEYVCQSVTEGISKVNLKYNLPIMFGILMVHNLEQALARSQFLDEKPFPYELNLGYDWAKSAIETLLEINRIEFIENDR